jgi:hypothetical protein
MPNAGKLHVHLIVLGLKLMLKMDDQSYNQPQTAEQLRTVQRLIDLVKGLVTGPDQRLQVTYFLGFGA